MQEPTDRAQDLSEDETRMALTIIEVTRGLSLDEFAEWIRAAMINGVASGRITVEMFATPDAHRRFCEKYGITPPMTEPEIREVVDEHLRRAFPGASR